MEKAESKVNSVSEVILDVIMEFHCSTGISSFSVLNYSTSLYEKIQHPITVTHEEDEAEGTVLYFAAVYITNAVLYAVILKLSIEGTI